MKIACIGDSLTEGVPGAAYVPLLRERLASDILINLGKGGDTVISLDRRLRRNPPPPDLDVALLWIGVNDVLAGTSRLYLMIKQLRGQPRTKKPEDFEDRYRDLARFLLGRTRVLLTVPPLFIGEDLDNPWNRALARMSAGIERVTGGLSRSRFIDLRSAFRTRLEGQAAAAMPDNPRRAGSGRFTVDGIHLNPAGAETTADILASAIEAQRRD